MRSFAGPHTQPRVRAGSAGGFAGPPAPAPVSPDRPSPVGRPAAASHNAVRYVVPPPCRGSPVPVCPPFDKLRVPAAWPERPLPPPDAPVPSPPLRQAQGHKSTRPALLSLAAIPRPVRQAQGLSSAHPLPPLDSLSHPQALHGPRADRQVVEERQSVRGRPVRCPRRPRAPPVPSPDPLPAV
jgi:hypothetical protein